MSVRMAPSPAVSGCRIAASIMPAALEARKASADAIAGLCGCILRHAAVAVQERLNAFEHDALKEHISRERKELLTSGFHGTTLGSTVCGTVKVPRSDEGRCGRGMFLQSKRAIRDFPAHTL